MKQLQLPYTARPRRQTRYTKGQVDAWVEMYQAGDSFRQIADATGANFSSVAWHLRKRGVSDGRKVGRRRKYLKMSVEEVRKNYWLKKLYGVDLAWYNQQLEEQDGVCAICGNPPQERDNQFGGRALHVDHDHETGDVRGLLCASCNTGLGKFNDSTALLTKAAGYLQEA